MAASRLPNWSSATWTKVYGKGSVAPSEVNILCGSLSRYHPSGPTAADAGSFGSDPFICAFMGLLMLVIILRVHGEMNLDLRRETLIITLDLIEQPFLCTHANTRSRFQKLIPLCDPRLNDLWDKRPASCCVVWHCFLLCDFVLHPPF